MQKVIITHVRNEEYLLQWWLPHHKNKFDHGVIIDYNSTDRTRELVKQHCPDWEFRPSVHPEFGAKDADSQVMSIEAEIFRQAPSSWVIALNVTEFLIGNTAVLDSHRGGSCFAVPVSYMIDPPELVGVEPEIDKPLHEQRTYGALYTHTETELKNRGCRLIHNYPYEYTLGRHYTDMPIFDDLGILWYGYSPYTEGCIRRKLQIQDNIPQEDKKNKCGWEHIIDRDGMYERLKRFQAYSTDLSDYIKRHEP